MAYYLLKLFASRPARYLDRVIVAAFAAAPALGHVEIAKRRWVELGERVSERVNCRVISVGDTYRSCTAPFCIAIASACRSFFMF